MTTDEQEQVDQSARPSGAISCASRLSPVLFSSPLQFIDDKPCPKFKNPPPSNYRLLFLNTTEWKEGLIGSLSAAVFGAVQPVYALTVGSNQNILYNILFTLFDFENCESLATLQFCNYGWKANHKNQNKDAQENFHLRSSLVWWRTELKWSPLFKIEQWSFPGQISYSK